MLVPTASHADEYNNQSDQLYQSTGQSNPAVRFIQKYVPSGTTIDQDYRNAGGNPDGNTTSSSNSGDDNQ